MRPISSLRPLAPLVLPLLLIGFGFALGTLLLPGNAGPVAQLLPPVTARPDDDALVLTPREQQISELYNTVSPSVVAINVTTGQLDRFGRPVYNTGQGSGFVISDAGHIVTNHHVVSDALPDGVEVNFVDGTIVRGEIIGEDPDSDLAVLRVQLPAEQLQPLSLGDSDELVIGQMALAIGSPFGQRWTLTTGVISALDRTIQGLTNYTVGSVIQTDAAINPGNSGGPLFNLQGEVIGVNSQIRSDTRSNSGVGFAIPGNLVRRVVNDLVSEGRVEYSYLGIGSDRPITLGLIESLGMPANLRGVVVTEVIPGGPAARAGLLRPAPYVPTLRRGQAPPRLTRADIITAIDGQPVYGMSSLVSWLASHTHPGDEVTLSIWRGAGETIELPLRLGRRPARASGG